jgi:lactoylglutathione lyase
MFTKVDYVMVNVSDMSRAVAFYRDALGVPLKFESPEWTEFRTGDTTLALHVAEKGDAEAGAGRSGPTAGTCTIAFSVESLDATYAELGSRGVRFVMPPTDQPGEGIRLALCVDPDGLTISFVESIAREGAGGD